jgi:hypothetical protein
MIEWAERVIFMLSLEYAASTCLFEQKIASPTSNYHMGIPICAQWNGS